MQNHLSIHPQEKRFPFFFGGFGGGGGGGGGGGIFTFFLIFGSSSEEAPKRSSGRIDRFMEQFPLSHRHCEKASLHSQ